MNTKWMNLKPQRALCRGCLAILVAVLCQRSFPQFCSRLTKAQLLNNTDNIETHIKIIPKGEALLRAELTTILTEEQELANILSMEEALLREVKALEGMKVLVGATRKFSIKDHNGGGVDSEGVVGGGAGLELQSAGSAADDEAAYSMESRTDEGFVICDTCDVP